MCRTNAVRKQSGYNLYMGWYLFWSVDEMVESTPYTCNWLKFSVVVACLFWLRRLYGAFLFCWAFKPFIIAAQCQMPTCLTSELPGHLPAKVSRCCSNDRLYFSFYLPAIQSQGVRECLLQPPAILGFTSRMFARSYWMNKPEFLSPS